MDEKEKLTSKQIAVIRTLWELAQGRIDDIYSLESAEQEKQALEEWIEKAFPNDHDEFIRSDSLRFKEENIFKHIGHELEKLKTENENIDRIIERIDTFIGKEVIVDNEFIGEILIFDHERALMHVDFKRLTMGPHNVSIFKATDITSGRIKLIKRD